MAKRSFYSRWSRWILIAHAILIPVACVSAIRAIKSNRNDVADWLPADYPETKELGWFREHFIADQFVLISWEGATLGEDPSGKDDDPRIARLVEALKEARLEREDGSGSDPVFKPDGITTGRTVLNELMSEPTSLGRRHATERLKGSLIGPDGKQTVVMANLTEQATKRLRKAIGRPQRRFGLMRQQPSPLFEALEKAGLSEDEVHLGGPPVDNNAIDEEGERSLVRLAGLAGLLGLTLSYYSLRSIRMTLVVFMCGILSAALALGIVYWSGSSMDAILMSMPALIYVLAVSGAVHLTNYYRQAVIHHGFEDAVERGVVHAWKPALLCSVTTAIGLASLHTSDITPIRKFGDFSAIGVCAMLIILFLFLPASLKVWPWIPPEIREKRKRGNAAAVKTDAHLHSGRRWEIFGLFVQRHHAVVSLACFATVVVLCLGLPQMRTSIDLLKLFSSDAKLLQDYRWFEERLGRIVPMELVVVFPEEVRQEDAPPQEQRPGRLVSRFTFLERLEMTALVQDSLVRRLGPEGDDLIGATMSATTFAPALGDEAGGTAATSYRYVANTELSKPETRRAFERSGFLRTDKEDGDELWRISVRVAAFTDIDQGETVKHVRAAVEPVLVARHAAVMALKRLSAQRHGQPQGAKVIFWRKPNADPAPESPGPFLATKNVRAFAMERSPEDMSDKLIEELKQFDGVVLGPGFTQAAKDRLRQANVPILATYDGAAEELEKEHTDDVNVVYSGVIPVVYKAQHELLNSLIKSSAWSFTTITPLMMFICGGIAAGIVMLLPNALPVLVVFGGMGWLGIPVDIGSMMAASIALGVAVDDTIHFMAWFADDYKVLGSRTGAVLSAYRRSATATLQAALINGLGLSVFATSSFTPTKRFGWLMLVIILAGMVAELIMCPSILFGPMGKAFERKKKLLLESGDPEPVDLERLDNGEAAAHDGPHVVREPQAARKA